MLPYCWQHCCKMAWRKRRKYPISAFTFLCLSAGILFIFGNLLMLNDGFVQLYQSTFGHEKDIPKELGPTSLQRHVLGPQDTLLQFPASALAIETKLRKLMEENRGHAEKNHHSPFILSQKQINHQQTSDTSSQSLVNISPRDLRDMLSLTSSCQDLTNVSFTQRNFIASGWTKAVYKAHIKGQDVAIKTVDVNGHDVSMCQQQFQLSQAQCYKHAMQKMLKEIVVLQGLKHPNIVEVLSYCVPQESMISVSNNKVTMVTELGQKLDLIKLLQMSWEDRLRIAYGLTKLLHYLATSPLGPLVLNDFRRQQFVLVGGEIKLTDVDDVGFEQPTCEDHHHCEQFFSSSNYTLRTKCVDSRCEGFNQRKNTFNAARHFTSFLLPHGAPSILRPHIDMIIDAYTSASWDAFKLLQHLHAVVDDYGSGAYLHRQQGHDSTAYQEILDSDLAGVYDYRCRYAVASSSCTLSVHDQKEAEELCDADPDCHAFVMTDKRSWTGRWLVHLKNNTTIPSPKLGTNLYIKPGYWKTKSAL